MSIVMIVVVIGLVSGMAVGIQAPFASMIAERLGALESVFIVHLGGAVAAGIPLLILGGGALGEWRDVPWYTLLAGVFGLLVIASLTYMIPRVGVAPAFIILVTGQLLIGVVLDHFGWLGTEVRPLSWQRMTGLGVVFAGIWLTMRG